MNVTFFGHKNAPTEKIKHRIYDCLIELIEKDGAEQFYVGNQGLFDRLVLELLKELKNKYPKIEYKPLDDRPIGCGCNICRAILRRCGEIQRNSAKEKETYH